MSLLAVEVRDGLSGKGDSGLLKQFDSIELGKMTDSTCLDSGKVTKDFYVGLRCYTPSNSDTRSLETLGACTCDKYIGFVNITNVL